MGGFFYFDAPSPGAENKTGFRGFTEAPVFAQAGGLYQENVTVSISVPAGARVYYTLDGSVPTVSEGTLYTKPFTLTGSTAVRARAFETGKQPSTVVSATYVLKTSFTLPVVCLVTESSVLVSRTRKASRT